MARKTLASNAAPIGVNDQSTPVDAVKFICDYPEYHFLMKVMDDAGNQVTHTDADGNGKLPSYKDYHFTTVITKDKVTGKADPNGRYSFFIVSKAKHGKDFEPILKRLEELKKQPHAKLFTEDEHFKRRNPEAFNIAKTVSELESKIDERDAKIKALEEKLNYKRP
jgi:hypothetical protein